MYYYSFSPNNLLSSVVRENCSEAYSQLTNLPTVRDSYLVLSSYYGQYMSTVSILTGSSGLNFACWFRSINSGSWARIFDFGNGPIADNIFLAANFGGSNQLGCRIFL